MPEEDKDIDGGLVTSCSRFELVVVRDRAGVGGAMGGPDTPA